MNVELEENNQTVEGVFEHEAEDAEATITEIKIVNTEDDKSGIAVAREDEENAQKPTSSKTNEVRVKRTQSKCAATKKTKKGNKKKLKAGKLKKVVKGKKKLSSVKKRKGKLKSKKGVKKSKSKSKGKWTRKAKRTLLAALKKYGPNDLKAISEMLPDIPVQHINARIFIYGVLAEYYYEDDLINKWLQCGICRPGDCCLSELLLFIKLFEKHPSTSESKFDYREIYDFLHRATSGDKQPLPMMKKRNRSMLLSLISRVDANAYPRRQKQLWEYLGRVYPRRKIRHVYPGKKLPSVESSAST